MSFDNRINLQQDLHCVLSKCIKFGNVKGISAVSQEVRLAHRRIE